MFSPSLFPHITKEDYQNITKARGFEPCTPFKTTLMHKTLKVSYANIVDTNGVRPVARRVNTMLKEMPIRRLNKSTWAVLEFEGRKAIWKGEVVQKDIQASRGSNLNGLMRSFKRLRDIINSNDINKTNSKWVTCTYAENMKDAKVFYADNQAFIRKLRNYYGIKFEYILAVEPQKRGALHSHIILITPPGIVMPFIPNDVLAKLWGKGFTKTKRIKEGDNISAYLCAYLTDTYNEKKKEKHKNARLLLYPPTCQLFRCSRGIKKPVRFYMPELPNGYVMPFPTEYKKSVNLKPGIDLVYTDLYYPLANIPPEKKNKLKAPKYPYIEKRSFQPNFFNLESPLPSPPLNIHVFFDSFHK